MAEVDGMQGRWHEAQDGYEEALRIWRELGGGFEVAEALVNLGMAQEQRGLVAEAMASYRGAIAAVESLRAQLKAEEARAGFLGTRLAPYERLVALCLGQPGHDAVAFDTVERAKARAFVELLTERPLRPPRAVPAQILQREAALRSALAHLYQMDVHAGASAGTPAAERAAALEAELEEVYRQMRRLDAQYTACRTVDPLALEEVPRRLAPGAALLEYFGVGEQLGCFVVTRTAAGVRLLAGAATVVQDYPFAASGTQDPAMPARRRASQELSAALLAPLEDLFGACAEL
jgi:hypothetical protein